MKKQGVMSEFDFGQTIIAVGRSGKSMISSPRLQHEKNITDSYGSRLHIGNVIHRMRKG